MNRLSKEALLLLIAAAPIVYMLLIWDQLPESIPTHFNLAGEADSYSSKSTAAYLVAGLNLFIYALMLITPKLDPKGKIMNMGGKYYSLRLIMQLFLAAISAYIVYAGHMGEIQNPNLLMVIIGISLALLGNYFQVLRQNYFIGIKTPWTLENETVWNKTHKLGGILWVIGGILISITAFFITNTKPFMIIGGILLAIMTLVPVAYSYLLHQKLRK